MANTYNIIGLFFIIYLCGFCDSAIEEMNFNSEDSSVQDEIRCYCNLPICVSTSYMCKSEIGICFSGPVEEEYEQSSFRSNDGYKRRHGCIELIQDEDQTTECRNMPAGGVVWGHEDVLLCCVKDMCNHVDNKNPYEMHNSTRVVSDSSVNNPEMMSPGYNNNEVWFKAAIIAVPICGIVILFLLIFLAVKMLKTDSISSSNKLGGPYSHSSDRKSNRDHFDQVHHQNAVSSKKIPLLIHQHHELSSGACTNHSSDELKHTSVPLLVQNETRNHSYDKKNEANAKINMAHGHDYNLVQNKEIESNSPLLGLQKPLNTCSSNNLYRNVNLSLTPVPTVQSASGEKLYDKQALTSVISWGPSNSSSPV